jgi:hypothetical protein
MEKGLQEIQNELSVLKSDVAEIKNLVREIHIKFIPTPKIKSLTDVKVKKQMEKDER